MIASTVIASTQYPPLNSLVARLGRSLLQYVVETTTWPAGMEAGLRLKQLAEQQRSHTSQLAQLITQRGGLIDLGIYPMEFAETHFLSFHFLLPLIQQDQQILWETLQAASLKREKDQEAAELLQSIARGEAEILQALRDLSSLHQETPGSLLPS